MRLKIILIFCISFFTICSYGQTSSTIQVKLNWRGIEKLHTSSSYIEVLNFDGARFSNDNGLPYFHHSVTVNDGYACNIEIKDPVFGNPSEEESLFIRDIKIPTEIETSSYISKSRDNKSFHLDALPFIMKDSVVLKLISFDLTITEQQETSKISKAATIHTYASSSVLSEGTFFKVKITESGVYRLTYDDLKAKGIEPSNIRVFGYGGNVLNEDFTKSKIDDLPEIAVHDTGNSIIFYGNGINAWTYESTKKIFSHKSNPYSHHGYFFITSSNVGEKKRITEEQITVPEGADITQITEFADYRLHEYNDVNLASSGKEFYGEKFTSKSTPLDYTFNFPNLSKSSDYKLRINAVSTNSASFDLTIGGSTYNYSISDGEKYDYAKGGSRDFSLIAPNTDDIKVRLKYTSSKNIAVGYLNYLEVTANRHLIMNGSVMVFNNVYNIGKNLYNEYIVTSANTNIEIWDITDVKNSKRIRTTLNGNKITFTDSAEKEKKYLAIDIAANNDFPKAEIIGEIPNQNIHGMSAIDMLIITHPLFIKQANELAQAHYDKDGLRVGVVTTEQVYNEFSSGTPDASAYRWAAKMFYDKFSNNDDKLKYLLLFGKGSYDNKKLKSTTGHNLLLTYQSDNSISETKSFVTDDYFGLMDDTEGINIINKDKMDIGIGRLPAITEQNAQNIVDKTIAYMNNTDKGYWKNQLCFIGDDNTPPNDMQNTHMSDVNEIADKVAQANPAFQTNKILLDAYQPEISANGKTYPAAKSRFSNLLRSGLFYLVYMGHGSTGGWSSERILDTKEIGELKNQHLPLIASGTCNFSSFDDKGVSGGEEIILNPLGGGIGSYSAARTVFANLNKTYLQSFSKLLFEKKDGEHPRIGDIIRMSKNVVNNDPAYPVNNLSYIYFGDPAVRLNYPTQYDVMTSEVNGKPIAEKDTLRALSINTIKGIVANTDGTIAESFNGGLQIVIFDKEQVKSTLDNSKSGQKMSFKERPNIIFKGKANVINGAFEFSFMLPKDIRYNYGLGRINYYAYDTESGDEGQGYFENFIVGGSSTMVIDENIVPDARIYLNHTDFKSGSKVNEIPLFVAELKSEYGINTSGAFPGHDIAISIDQSQYIELNDYFEITGEGYKNGRVSFVLPEMSEGRHTLSFRAWDLLNNSVTRSLEFEVIKGLKPNIFSVYNYPNPVSASGSTKIVVEHDREEEVISMNVDIFDFSGKRIWSMKKSGIDEIVWDLSKESGGNIQPGIYIYRVSVQTDDKIISTKSNKIIVTKQ